jgi:hypothetical protein
MSRSGAILAVIGVVLIFCVEAWGADWSSMSIKDADGTTYEINSANIIPPQPNNVARAWVKQTFSEQKIENWVRTYGKRYRDLSSIKQLVEFNCPEKKRRSITTILYSSGGRVIDSVKSSGEWRVISPGSVYETLLKIICQRSVTKVKPHEDDSHSSPEGRRR